MNDIPRPLRPLAIAGVALGAMLWLILEVPVLLWRLLTEGDSR